MDASEVIYISVCRICSAQSICDSKDLDPTPNGGQSSSKQSEITVDNVVLKSDDKIPTICKTCDSLLRRAAEFREHCEFTDFKLKRILKTVRPANTDN